MKKYEEISNSKLDAILENLPTCQKEAVRACVNAATAKSPKGRRYTKAWMYECILMRMKGPALYRKMQEQNIIALPSPRQIQRYLKKMKPAYGFQNATFELLEKKVKEMKEDEKHGAILIDEMKLKEGITFDKNTLKVIGITDMGDATPEEDKKKPGDHALVMLFQPFKGRWIQSIAAFLTRGAAKGKQLAMLLLDAVTRLEQLGLRVDVIVSDGAPWNRTMWSEFGMVRTNNEKELEEDEEDILLELERDEDWELTLDLEDVPLPGDTQHQQHETQNEANTGRRRAQQASKKKGAVSKRESKNNNILPPKQKSKTMMANEHRIKFVSAQHPLDSRRKIWFASDFPHLVKSIKERILHKEILKTPDGKVHLQHWKIVFEEDSKKCIRIAPKLKADHFVKKGFLTMRVGLAFSMFSEQVAVAMQHYASEGVKGLEDCGPTVAFIRRMNKLIEAMNANLPSTSLRPKSSDDILEDEDFFIDSLQPKNIENDPDYGPQSKKPSREFVEEFLTFLKEWETSGVKRDFRLSSQTAFGLRVTLTGALELTDYLTSQDIGFEYLMTKRINQDALEHFFGRVRQHCRTDPHPDPLKFIQIYRLLSAGSLIKPPRGSNITGAEMLESLLRVEDIMDEQIAQRKIDFEKALDDALDSGTIIDEIDKALGDHTYHNEEKLSDYALRPFTGYVARKARNFSTAKTCDECYSNLKAPIDQPKQEIDSIINARTKGYLITPSDTLYKIIRDLEVAILQTLKIIPFEDNLIFTVLDHVKNRSFQEVGCQEHKRQITKDIITFYLNTRLIFACEEYNRYQSEAAAQKRKAKQLLKQQRLVS